MHTKEVNTPINILLADDDTDDRFFFEKALKEIAVSHHLTTVENGEELMDYLSQTTITLPDIIFLDISMPRKTGIECLIEIKNEKSLEHIPVLIFTTSFTRGMELEMKLSNTLFTMGAQDYLRKPAGFEELKQVLNQAIIKVREKIHLKTEEGMTNE